MNLESEISDFPLPKGNFGAVLFDCDGTLADTMPLHYLAWRRLIRDAGGDFPEELFYSWGGRPPAEILGSLSEMYSLRLNVAESVKLKENYYLDLLHLAKPIEPVLKLATILSGKIPMAVVSGGTKRAVIATLQAIGAGHLFDEIITSDDYPEGKPSPTPFLVAAQRLRVEPQSCLVFEDSPTGIQAAKAAGMKFVSIERGGSLRLSPNEN